MDPQDSSTLSVFSSQSQPLQLSQGSPVIVQQLEMTQSGQINQPDQQSLGIPTSFSLDTGQQFSVSTQMDLNINPTGVSTQEQQPVDLQAGGSVFATVPVGIPVADVPQQPSSEIANKLDSFWHDQLAKVQNVPNEHWKNPEFPLARIRKIMRMDEDVRLISAEVPVMFSKAVEIFISELSMRAWQHTEESKRRTIQRSDVAMAITKNDMFDFLIDIVPREEIQLKTKPTKNGEAENLQLLPPDLLQMYIQQMTASTNAEEGDSSVLQHQLQILQQLLHIQQLQEQQQQGVTSLPPSTTVNQQQTSIPSTTTSGEILEAQVLQASSNQGTTPDINMLEQLTTTGSHSNTSNIQVSAGELHRIKLLEQSHGVSTATVVIQPPLMVPSTQTMDTAVLDSGVQYHIQSLPEQPVDQQNADLQRQLESIAQQVLVQPATDSVPFTTNIGSTNNAAVELPADFGTSLVERGSGEFESGSTRPVTTSLAPSTNDLVAFKSTPLRLTHVHGGSSLVQLSDVSSTT